MRVNTYINDCFLQSFFPDEKFQVRTTPDNFVWTNNLKVIKKNSFSLYKNMRYFMIY